MSAGDFGPHPGRPDHADFWRISEIVRANDSTLDAAADKEAEWKRIVGDVIDINSVTYMASQRAMRILGPPTSRSIVLHSQVAALFVDAFIAGAMYQARGGHQNEGQPT